MRTKTDGQGTMLSMLIAREFGFTFNLIEEELMKVLSKVNEKRKNVHYLNSKAAMELHGTTKKMQRMKMN